MQNIEYKAELRDLPLARAIAARIGATPAEVMQQTDTYYRIADARMKRRDIAFIEEANYGQRVIGSERMTEYIRYERRDDARARVSEYTVWTPEKFRELFGESDPPVAQVVRKVRELLLYRGVRIHLDVVEGLGTYIEFEAPVTSDRPEGRCRELVAKLIEAFRPVMGEPIGKSYADLLAEK